VNDVELWKSVGSALGAFAPFAVLAWWIIKRQAEMIAAKDAQLAAINDKILDAFKAGTAALTEVKAELRSQQ
jgi:hypothetical protein